MKRNFKTAGTLLLAALLALSLAACGQTGTTEQPDQTGAAFTNGGLTLSVPQEYADLLTVDTPQDSPDGTLFSVTETASAEAAAALGYEEEDIGAGWLFSIGTVSADALHEMLCYDMSGQTVFAKGEDGSYYVFYHPTDVRYVREDNEAMAADQDQWTALNEWAWTVPETFAAENQGLTAQRFGNTDLEMYLSRVAYQDDADFTVSTTEFGPLFSDEVDPSPFAERLLTGATYEEADLSLVPDGEYVVLAFPADDIRFDFFPAQDGENYIRQVWSGDNEMLYRASYENGSVEPNAVMQELYDAYVAAGAQPGEPFSSGDTTQADPMTGIWTEQIAGRGVIEITPAAEAGQYQVHINWGSSAFETAVWDMTAVLSGDGSLTYDSGRHVIVTFSEDGAESEEVQYEDGTGTFSLNDEGQLVWQDDTGHAGDDTVFLHME